MTIGERIDDTLADGLVAAGRGIRLGLTIAAKIGDRLLGGSPYNERAAQRFLEHQAAEALAKREAESEVLDPWHADGGPTDWQSPAPRRRLLDEPLPDGCKCEPAHGDYSGALVGDCPVPEHHTEWSYWATAPIEHNTLPKWQPHTSAPARPPTQADAADTPSAAPTPPRCGAASGSQLEWKSVPSLYVQCSYPMRPDAVAASDTCRQPARTAVQPVDNRNLYLYRCAHHEGMVDGDTPGLIFDSIPTGPQHGDEQPAGAGDPQPGIGEVALVRNYWTGCCHSSCVPPATSADQATSALMAALINQVRIMRFSHHSYSYEDAYLDELIADSEKRAEQHAEIGD